MPLERITPALCIALWTHAAELEFGIAIETDNVRRLQDELYRVRKSHPNMSWSGLVVVLPQPGTHVWLVKKTAEEALS